MAQRGGSEGSLWDVLREAVDVEEVRRNWRVLRQSRLARAAALVVLVAVAQSSARRGMASRRRRTAEKAAAAPPRDAAQAYALGFFDARARRPFQTSLRDAENAAASRAFAEFQRDIRHAAEQELVEETIRDTPAEPVGVREEWATKTGWNRREDPRKRR